MTIDIDVSPTNWVSSEEIIREMSTMKKEPDWMLDFRFESYQRFLSKPIPTWERGGALRGHRLRRHLLLTDGEPSTSSTMAWNRSSHKTRRSARCEMSEEIVDDPKAQTGHKKDLVMKDTTEPSERYERERRAASERHRRKLEQMAQRDRQKPTKTDENDSEADDT